MSVFASYKQYLVVLIPIKHKMIFNVITQFFYFISLSIQLHNVTIDELKVLIILFAKLNNNDYRGGLILKYVYIVTRPFLT